MKKFLKHILSLTLIVALLSTVAIPVFAAEADVTPRSGTSSGSFYLSGQKHDFNAYIGASSTDGAYTCVTVLDETNVGRLHQNLTVVFITTDSGYQTRTGGYKNITCQRYSQSYCVVYGPGMSYVTGYRSIKGNILIYGDTTRTIELST